MEHDIKSSFEQVGLITLAYMRIYAMVWKYRFVSSSMMIFLMIQSKKPNNILLTKKRSAAAERFAVMWIILQFHTASR